MAQVPVRELNQHTADVLARVEGGERVRPATRTWRGLSADQDPVDGSPGVAAVELDRRSYTRW